MYCTYKELNYNNLNFGQTILCMVIYNCEAIVKCMYKEPLQRTKSIL